MARRQELSVFRAATGTLRVLPDFLIIGAQKGGTSSLYQYLIQHPAVLPAVKKEVHYFDWEFHRGERWYRGHFPSVAYRMALQAITRQHSLVGEATPYYLFHPHVPGRVKALLPGVKLIVLLRDPVERTLSAYQHQVRRGRELLSLGEALDREPQRLGAEIERLERDSGYNSEAHRHYSYVARGVYADQLTAWFEHFPREQFLIIRSEDFFESTPSIFGQVLAFLRVSEWRPQAFTRFNAAARKASSPSPDGRIDIAQRKRLVEYFAVHNQRLYDLIGRDLGWPR